MCRTRCLSAMLLLLALAACTQRDPNYMPREGTPRYLDPGVGSPPRQTDFFGNDLLPR